MLTKSFFYAKQAANLSFTPMSYVRCRKHLCSFSPVGLALRQKKTLDENCTRKLLFLSGIDGNCKKEQKKIQLSFFFCCMHTKIANKTLSVVSSVVLLCKLRII